jgi:hypothetical protein
LNPKKEKARKKLIRDNEKANAVKAYKVRLGAERIHQLMLETQKYKNAIRETITVGNENLEHVAKDAYRKGFQDSYRAGIGDFRENEEELVAEGKKAAKEFGTTRDFGADAQKKAAERATKSASLAAHKQKLRAKESAAKDSARDEAMALSAQATALINSEAAQKAALAKRKENKEKSVDKKRADNLARRTTEREKKKLRLIKQKDNQNTAMEDFKLQQAVDKERQYSSDIELHQKEKANKKAAREQEQRIAKQIEETSGAREREAKDEAKAAAKESKTKEVEASKKQAEINKLMATMQEFKAKEAAQPAPGAMAVPVGLA